MNATEKVLVVDDEPAVRGLLGRLLSQAGYESRLAAGAKPALAWLSKERFALALLDIMLPGMDGRQLLLHIRRRHPQVSVMMVTAVVDIDVAVAALREGACDYVCKPFQGDELLMRVDRALERRRVVMGTWLHGEALRGALQDQLRRLERVALGAVQSLVFAVEAKDPFARGHSQRVADLALVTATHMGIPNEDAAQVHVAGLLHDVGKIAIKEVVLNKPGPLTREERQHVQTHSAEGARILRPLLPEAQIVAFVRHHHERWDGEGYPEGLAQLRIPVGARILAVADAYDAMTSMRPYRAPLTKSQAMRELRNCVGSQFDPDAVRAFQRALSVSTPGTGDVTLPPYWPWQTGALNLVGNIPSSHPQV